MSLAPKNYNWIIDNTNVMEAHEVISGLFAQGAIAVNIRLRVNGETQETEIRPWENIYVVMSEFVDEEAEWNELNNINIEFVSAEKSN